MHTPLTAPTNNWVVIDKATDYRYEGCPKEIVLNMSRQDFIVASKTDYMLEVQDRVFGMTGQRMTIVSGDFEGFLRQLETLGLIEIQVE